MHFATMLLNGGEFNGKGGREGGSEGGREKGREGEREGGGTGSRRCVFHYSLLYHCVKTNTKSLTPSILLPSLPPSFPPSLFLRPAYPENGVSHGNVDVAAPSLPDALQGMFPSLLTPSSLPPYPQKGTSKNIQTSFFPSPSLSFFPIFPPWPFIVPPSFPPPIHLDGTHRLQKLRLWPGLGHPKPVPGPRHGSGGRSGVGRGRQHQLLGVPGDGHCDCHYDTGREGRRERGRERGRAGWGGAGSTNFWACPETDTVIVTMTQVGREGGREGGRRL